MAETTTRGVVNDVLRRAGYDPISVENPAYPGTPDVNYAEGWIELKQVDEWPVRPDTPLRVDHYTTQQKVWGIRRRLAGGRCHLLLQVRNDWLLFDAEIARKVLGHTARIGLEQASRANWHSKASMQEGLAQCLFEPQISLRVSDFYSPDADAAKLRQTPAPGTE